MQLAHSAIHQALYHLEAVEAEMVDTMVSRETVSDVQAVLACLRVAHSGLMGVHDAYLEEG